MSKFVSARRWLKILLEVLGVVALVAGLSGGWLVVTVSQIRAQFLVHQTADRAHSRQTPADYGLAFENLTLTTRDGLKLAAWYIPSRNGAAVIAQHGFRGTRQQMLARAQMLARHGYGVLLIDARDHGDSEGDTITFGLKEVLDVRAGLDYLLGRPDVDAGRIGAVGISQGAVTLLLAAAQYPEIRAYVGDSPYATLPDEIATGVRAFTGLPPFPFAPFMQYFAERDSGFSADLIAPLDHIAQISPRPVLLIQGGQDAFIPVNSGQRLYDAAGRPKELWFVPEADHTHAASTRPAEYEQRLTAFFDTNLPAK
jgi:fermentation-respiration switch protein FrsA (DUF1100 family)